MSSDPKSAPAKNATTAMGYFWKAREMLTPTLKQSAFLTDGMLTPDEFVRAGDELVYRCPTWSWCGGGIGPKSYLPPDKQFLITRNVPCRDRVATLERSTIDMMLQEQNDAAADGDPFMDDWLVSSTPNHQESNRNNDQCEDDFDVLDEDGEVIPTGKANPNDIGIELQKDDTEEYADMADFEDADVLVDDDCAGMGQKSGAMGATALDSHIVKVRTYDLSITYDNYYRTPRIWMTGKSASGHPLTAKETMEDVITDYANKTVTMEAHPHISGPHASIHPCKHGAVMKTIVRNLVAMTSSSDSAEQGTMPAVEMYLFIFLKFVSSIIPTINYDFTMDVTANTSK